MNINKYYCPNIFYYISGGLVLILVLLAGLFQYSRAWDRGFVMTPLSKLPTDNKVVALTFDDGPSAQKTIALLDLLSQYDVKVTFFMLGENIEKYPEIARSVLDNGHLIGNHSYDHDRLIFKTPNYIKKQINDTDKLIYDLGQHEVKYFRPPYSSKFIILPVVLRVMNKVLVTGTYDPPAEYEENLDGSKVADQVLENVKPGMIVYLHDGNDRDIDEFIAAVERIIVGLQQQGYSIVRLDEKEI